MRKIYLMFLSLLLLGCTKQQTEFLTQSDFIVNNTAREFEVEVKQSGWVIDAISVDHETFYDYNVNPHFADTQKIADGTYEYKGILWTYSNNKLTLIKGNWFEIKVKDTNAITLSITENTTGKDRDLSISVTWKVLPKRINIHQKG